MFFKCILCHLFVISALNLLQNNEASIEVKKDYKINNTLMWRDDDDLQKLFEKFFQKVTILIKGNDPFNYPGSEFNIDSYGLICKGYVKDLSLSSISTISITKLKVTENPVNFELGVGFTLLQILGKYKLNFDFLTMLPLFGEGDMGAAASNINMSVAILIGKQDKSDIMQLSTFNLNVTVKSLKADIQNIFDNPAFGHYISNIITDISPDILSSFGRIVKAAEGKVKYFINNFLIEQKITLEKVIEIVKQFIR